MTIPTLNEMNRAESSEGYEFFANQIMQEFSLKTLRDSDEILIYQNGIYRRGGDSYIKEKCQEIISKCSTNKVKEVINIIKRSTYVSRDEFDNHPNLLNLENGILNIVTGMIQGHSPEHLFENQIPIVYESNLPPVKFMKFMMDTLPDVENRTNALEVFASTLLKDLKLEKMVMNVGEGANGKSTFLNVVERFLGSENVSNTSIHDLVSHPFAKSRLDGMMANIYADVSKRDIPELGAVKALISGDSIDVEKKHQQPFKMKNTAKMIFSCNELPEIGEDSHAVYRRMLLIQWNQQFTHDGNNRINPNLIHELTTSQELSGILNLLIKVAQKLQTRGKFKFDSKTAELRKIWSLKSDPIGKFLEAHIEKDFETILPKSELYAAFVKWCRENEITSKSEKALNAKVSETLGINPTSKRIEGKVTKCWQGIRILDDVTSVTTVTSLISLSN